MATVTFANGKSVNFQGTPTPQDIDYVAQQMGIQPQKPNSLLGDAEGAAQWLGNAVASPAESLGVHLAQATAPYIAKATDAVGLTKGEETKVESRLEQPTKNLTGGTVAPLKGGLGTALQLAGDLGSTALTAVVPDSTGVLKMAGLGAASGLTQSVAQGNTAPGQLLGDTASGAAFGGVLGGLTSGLTHASSLLKGLTGITPQIENELKNVAPSVVDQYFNAAISHEGDAAAPSAYNEAEKEFDQRADLLTDKLIPEAGAALGAARKEGATLPVVLKQAQGPVLAGKNAAMAVYEDVSRVLGEMTGHAFGVAKGSEGVPGLNMPSESKSILYQLPGRGVQLTDTESTQLQKIQGYLQRLVQNPTVQEAVDTVTNIKTEVGNWKNPQFGSPNSPVKGAIKYAYGAVKQLITNVSPEIADANDRYAQLSQLRDEIAKQAGQEGQSASLMMRRVLSGDKSSAVIPVLQQLDAVTAPFRPQGDASLVSHAVLSDWATRNFSGTSGKTLFKQAIESDSSLFGYTKAIVGTVLRESFKFATPDKLEFAKSISQGNPQSLNLVARMAQKAMDSTQVIPLVKNVVESLNKHGLNPTMATPIVEKLIKTALFEKLTAPNK